MLNSRTIKSVLILLISIPLLSSCSKEVEVQWTEKTYETCLANLTKISTDGFEGNIDEQMLKSLNTVTTLTCDTYQSKCASDSSDSDCERFISSLENL